MENASKALVMAGSVLIALMIIGALMLTYNGIRDYQKTETVNLAEAQVKEFNNQFITYNRNDVRGNDLYSLLNRAVDYNTRKTTASASKDAKEKLAFQPITIKMNFKGWIREDSTNPFSVDGSTRLITENEYEASNTVNTFEDEINATVKTIEATYGQDSANGLATGLTKIFIEGDTITDSRKEEAVNNFNAVSKKVRLKESNLQSNWDKIKEGSPIREDIYTYYEYIQFKRAIFECTHVEYNKETGRIIGMDFEFTEKIQ